MAEDVAMHRMPPEVAELLVGVPWPLWVEAIATTALSHAALCTCPVCEYVRGGQGRG
jgi:hypothetical protein